MKTTKVLPPPSFPDLRGCLMGVKYPAIVEPKYDGEINIWDGKRLTNRYGKQRWDFPAVNNLPNEQLLGELYYGDGKKISFYQFLEHKEDVS